MLHRRKMNHFSGFKTRCMGLRSNLKIKEDNPFTLITCALIWPNKFWRDNVFYHYMGKVLTGLSIWLMKRSQGYHQYYNPQELTECGKHIVTDLYIIKSAGLCHRVGVINDQSSGRRAGPYYLPSVCYMLKSYLCHLIPPSSILSIIVMEYQTVLMDDRSQGLASQ